MLNWFKSKKNKPIIDSTLRTKASIIVDDLIKQNSDMSMEDIIVAVSNKLGIDEVIKAKMETAVYNGLYTEDRSDTYTEALYIAIDKPCISLKTIAKNMSKLLKRLDRPTTTQPLTKEDMAVIDSVTLQPDSRKRVLIPSSIVKQLKAKPGDKIAINATITSKKNPGKGWDLNNDKLYARTFNKEYVVDKYYNVRVALKPLNLGHLKSIYCIVNKNSIVLS